MLHIIFTYYICNIIFCKRLHYYLNISQMYFEDLNYRFNKLEICISK